MGSGDRKAVDVENKHEGKTTGRSGVPWVGAPVERGISDAGVRFVMVQSLRLRKRRRLRKKEAQAVWRELVERFAMQGIDEDAVLEGAELDHSPVYLHNNRVIALELEGSLAPGLRGLLKWPAGKGAVTVDMGAVRFLTNGADVMAPGITEVDAGIQEGDAVWMRDETHGRPLAVGVAMKDAEGLKGEKGKVIANKHYIGDALWGVGEEA
jgi:PUA-domain protein